MKSYITMGTMADQIPEGLNAVREFYYRRLVREVSHHLPPGWRDWVVNRAARLGRGVRAEQVLLALRAEGLARVFGGDADSLRAEDLRLLNDLMLTWELGRALVVLPRHFYWDTHVVDHLDGVASNPLLWRHDTHEAVCALRAHRHCPPGAPQRAGPWARRVLAPPAPPAPPVWDTMTLEEAVAGVSGPFHVCNLFPDF